MQTIQRGGPRWRHTVYACMSGRSVPSLPVALGLMPLWLASCLYRGIVGGRRASYTLGVCRSKQLPCGVVSIGNLTLGGTGKTPLTIWVARWYQQLGWRVVVLSRGYGAQTTRPCQVIAVDDETVVDWRTVGDEPYLLARALPGVPVLIGRDRYTSGRCACERFGAQIVILDDGFQHYALHRDLDIVLIDAGNPFGSGDLVPRGILREPLRALRRADAIVVTRAEMAEATLSTLYEQIRRYSSQPIYTMSTAAAALYQGTRRLAEGPAWLRRRRVVAFAGIGHPEAFAATLAQLGSEVVTLLVFPDHHVYTDADWRVIIAVAQQHRVECLVTTEKDAVRLALDWHAPIPVYTLHIGVQFAPASPPFQHMLQTVTDHADTHA